MTFFFFVMELKICIAAFPVMYAKAEAPLFDDAQECPGFLWVHTQQ